MSVQSQTLDRIVGELNSDKKSNYKFKVAKKNKLVLDEYSFSFGGEKKTIIAEGEKWYLKSKSLKPDLSPDKPNGFYNVINEVLTDFEYEQIGAFEIGKALSYRKLITENQFSYVLVLIPIDINSKIEFFEFHSLFEYNIETEAFLKDPSFELLYHTKSSVDRLSYPDTYFMENFYWDDCSQVYFPQFEGVNYRSEETKLFSPPSPPSHGDVYVELVTRHNKSWKTIGQKFAQPLVAGQCYEFDIDLKFADQFDSHVVQNSKKNISSGKVSFAHPICLEIGLSMNACSFTYSIFESEPVDHTEWQTYTVSFIADKNYSYFMMSARMCGPNEIYDGNMMIDNIKNFREVECKK